MTSKSPVGDISVVTLIRTDTTLDHSQKAEKVCTTRLCVQRPVFSIYWACVRRCVPAHAWREFGPRRVPKSKAHASSDNFFAARPPVIWGSFARICAQRAAAAPGGTQGASAPPQLSWQSMHSVSVWSWVRSQGGFCSAAFGVVVVGLQRERGLQHSAAKCARMAMATRRTLGRSPRKNCKNDLDDQT